MSYSHSQAPTRHITSQSRRECRTASREPLHFIVTTVTVVTLPISRGFLRDSPLLRSTIYRHPEWPFSMQFSEWCDSRDACDGCLRVVSRRGTASLLYKPLSLQPNPTNPTTQLESRISMRFSSIQSASGLSERPTNPTPYPTRDLPCHQAWGEHRRVLDA